MINRGGETLSPFEIEDAMRSHPALREVMAFSAPHSLFQETVRPRYPHPHWRYLWWTPTAPHRL